MSVRRPRILLACLALLFALPAAAQEELKPGAQGPEEGPYREQSWRIPVLDSDGKTIRLLEALLFRPPGEMRRPLVIINHGTPRRPEARLRVRPHWAERPAAFFVAQGYAVIAPMRRGYGRSPGDADERLPGGCANPDYAAIGLRIARQILAVAGYMAKQRFVAPGKIVLAGQSAGGFASLAAASLNPPGILGVVNFAGGRGSRAPDDICNEANLVAAMKRFGATTRIPSIWLYAENDSYFRPDLARRMHEAYVAAGAHASLHILRAYGNDGHGFLHRADSEAEWQPLVRAFLATLDTGAQPAAVPPFPDTSPRFEILKPGAQ